MLDIAAQSGICAVQQSMLETTGGPGDFHSGMCAILVKLARATANQAQLGVGIEATMLDPTTKKKVLTRYPETVHRRGSLQCSFNFRSQFRFQRLVRIQLQYPIPRCLIHRRIFLYREALPRFDEDLGAERLSDLQRSIG